MKKVQIVDPNKINEFDSVEEYLLHTYGKKKLKEARQYREYTHLDVIGYTTKDGFETNEGAYYELEDIERNMHNKWRKRK